MGITYIPLEPTSHQYDDPLAKYQAETLNLEQSGVPAISCALPLRSKILGGFGTLSPI